jgi:hypothetical protein
VDLTAQRQLKPKAKPSVQLIIVKASAFASPAAEPKTVFQYLLTNCHSTSFPPWPALSTSHEILVIIAFAVFGILAGFPRLELAFPLRGGFSVGLFRFQWKKDRDGGVDDYTYCSEQ